MPRIAIELRQGLEKRLRENIKLLNIVEAKKEQIIYGLNEQIEKSYEQMVSAL